MLKLFGSANTVFEEGGVTASASLAASPADFFSLCSLLCFSGVLSVECEGALLFSLFVVFEAVASFSFSFNFMALSSVPFEAPATATLGCAILVISFYVERRNRLFGSSGIPSHSKAYSVEGRAFVCPSPRRTQPTKDEVVVEGQAIEDAQQGKNLVGHTQCVKSCY